MLTDMILAIELGLCLAYPHRWWKTGPDGKESSDPTRTPVARSSETLGRVGSSVLGE